MSINAVERGGYSQLAWLSRQTLDRASLRGGQRSVPAETNEWDFNEIRGRVIGLYFNQTLTMIHIAKYALVCIRRCNAFRIYDSIASHQRGVKGQKIALHATGKKEATIKKRCCPFRKLPRTNLQPTIISRGRLDLQIYFFVDFDGPKPASDIP